MKVENMLKIKEEFDYKSLSKRLEVQVDKLIAENERQQKAFEAEVERIRLEAQKHVMEAERNYAEALKVDNVTYLSWLWESFAVITNKTEGDSDQEPHIGECTTLLS